MKVKRNGEKKSKIRSETHTHRHSLYLSLCIYVYMPTVIETTESTILYSNTLAVTITTKIGSCDNSC